MATEKLILDVKVNDSAAVRGFKKITNLAKGLTKIYKKQGDTFSAVMSEKDMEIKREEQSIKTLIGLAAKLSKAERMLADAGEDEYDAIKKRMDLYEKQYEKALKGASDYAKALDIARKAAKKLNEEEEARKFDRVAEVAGFSGQDTGKDLAEGFADALDSLSGGSLKGFASSLVKMMGTGAKGIGGGVLRGAAANAEAGKSPGGMSKAVNGLIGIVGKLGPVLAAASSAIVGIVKLFLDAESAAKDFNKEILSTSGTAGFLKRNMGDTAAAAAELQDTLKQVYDSATAIKGNWTWGISKEQHAAVINALTSEGVKLESLKDAFDDVGKTTQKSSGYVKDWGSMVQMSVAYSRAFGVSLSEIAQFQGDMMTETGANFDMLQSGFETMLSSVQEAGIGANKFFAQIREISADLNLFNLRMGDAAKLMGKLDKVMNPRKASEFFRNISSMFKNMGLIERTKSTLLGGTGKTKQLLSKDLEGKIDGLAADIDSKLGKGTGDELKKVIRKPKELMKWMAKIDATDAKRSAKLDGATRGALLDASRMSDKLQKGGLVDIASALKDANPMTAIDHLDNVAKNFFGKPVEELSDVQRIAFESLTGVNDEQVDQLSKFKASLDMTKETLKAKLEAGAKLTDDEITLIRKLGIDEKDANAAAALGNVDARKFYDFMDKSQQDALKDGAHMIDYQKETAGFQTSLLSRIDMIIDFLMNQAYNAMIGIWETIAKIPGIGGDAKRDIAKAGNKELTKALSDAGGDFAKARDAILNNTDVGKDFTKTLETGAAQMADLQKKRDSAGSEQEKSGIDKQMNDLFVKMKLTNDLMATDLKGIAYNSDSMNKIQKAAEAAGIKDNSKIEKLRVALTQGKSGSDLASASGLSEEEIGRFMSKAQLEIDPVDLAKNMASLVRVMGNSTPGGGGSPGQPAAAAPTPGAPDDPSAAKAAAAPAAAKPVSAKDMAENTDSTNKTVAEEFEETRRKARTMSGGFALNGPFLKNQYGTQIEDSVYNATSKALFEYYLLQQSKFDDVTDALKRGVAPRDIGPSLVKGFSQGMQGSDIFSGMAKGNAEGGLVMRPAPGEFMASVKPGEHIVPSGGGVGGGGATRVVIELKGDMLKQIMRATALNTIAENDRAQARR